MSTADDGTTYFIRVRGQVLGPYSVKQLQTLRTRGQFSQSNEVSPDRVAWVSAATLEQVFKAAPRKSQPRSGDIAVEPAGGASTTPAAADQSSERPIWYYSLGDVQSGPVTLTDLRTLFLNGKLSSRERVWRDGMSDWSSPTEVAELNGVVPAGSQRGVKSSKRASSQADAKSADDRASHFLDIVLSSMRSLVGASDFASTRKAAVEVGRYAIYVSIVANIAFCFLYAVKIDSVTIGMAGIGYAGAALVLQYSAIKLCHTITLLIRATTLRMSSTAFIDSFAVLMLIGGAMSLVASAFGWMRTEQAWVLMIGIAVFAACEQLALLALHPEALCITITPRATSGEEAIAILSFFLMLPLRFVAGVFGIGTACSVLGTCWAFKLLLEGGNSLQDALAYAILSGQVALICAAYPFIQYIYFVFVYLLIDVIRSILIVPDKLDQLKQSLEPVE